MPTPTVDVKEIPQCWQLPIAALLERLNSSPDGFSNAVRGKVLREGKHLEIMLSEMVPGDVVFLAAGDLVPCDGRVLEAKDFFVNQALLTGEPFPWKRSLENCPKKLIFSRPAIPFF